MWQKHNSKHSKKSYVLIKSYKNNCSSIILISRIAGHTTNTLNSHFPVCYALRDYLLTLNSWLIVSFGDLRKMI